MRSPQRRPVEKANEQTFQDVVSDRPGYWTTRERHRLLQQGAVLGGVFGVFWGDYHGGGYFVVGVEVQEFYAHGGAAGGSYALGVDADDFCRIG
jgi:hypothetical protein